MARKKVAGKVSSKISNKVGEAASLAAIEERKTRMKGIVRELKKLYPDSTCALEHDTALKLLVATILSAQSTDETVNKVTPALFRRYPTVSGLAEADPSELERIIHSTGFFRQKARSIIGACRKIIEEFGGEVPDNIADLTQLPGVARKTANVIVGTWFGKNEGVVVDTHVGRLAHRLGLTWTGKDTKDAVRIEQDLMQIIPRKQWTFTAHALVWHGRRVCDARKPRCIECTLSSLCASAFTFEPSGEGKPAARKGKKS